MIPFSDLAAHYAFNHALNDYGTDTAEGFSMYAGLKWHSFDEAADASANFAELFTEWCESLPSWPERLRAA